VNDINVKTDTELTDLITDEVLESMTLTQAQEGPRSWVSSCTAHCVHDAIEQ
jgi:hypothetical protein